MACLWVYGGIIILFIALGGIFWSLRKEREKLSLIIVIFLIIIIPFWLNKIIYRGWYRVVPMESSLKPEEWMSFLGSYFSVAGTVIIGALAYWQTKVNRERDSIIAGQSETIKNLQKQIAIYQVKPVIHVKKGKIKTYTEKQNEYSNKGLYNNLYYMMFNAECSLSEGAFIYIVIPYIEKNIIPIEKIKISELVWKIDSVTYEVDLSKGKYTLAGNKIQILLDKNIKIKDSLDGQKNGYEFIQRVARHQSYYSNGKAGFDSSWLKIKLVIINQLGKSREYNLEYQICSEYKGEKLPLKNPHIKIVDTDEGQKAE